MITPHGGTLVSRIVPAEERAALVRRRCPCRPERARSPTCSRGRRDLAAGHAPRRIRNCPRSAFPSDSGRLATRRPPPSAAKAPFPVALRFLKGRRSTCRRHVHAGQPPRHVVGHRRPAPGVQYLHRGRTHPAQTLFERGRRSYDDATARDARTFAEKGPRARRSGTQPHPPRARVSHQVRWRRSMVFIHPAMGKPSPTTSRPRRDGMLFRLTENYFPRATCVRVSATRYAGPWR
jgi:hypothetical protein